MNSCCTFIDIRLINHTGEPIIIYSSYTKKLVSIDNGESESIDHMNGYILAHLSSGKTWHYNELSTMDLSPPYRSHTRWRLPCSTLGINFLIDYDGKIYVIPSGTWHINTRKLKQPVGFPLVPKLLDPKVSSRRVAGPIVTIHLSSGGSPPKKEEIASPVASRWHLKLSGKFEEIAPQATSKWHLQSADKFGDMAGCGQEKDGP